MQIKVCGLRRPTDFTELANLQVDYLGLALNPASPQYADSDTLINWLESNRTNSSPSLVGIFENAEIEVVLNAIHDYHLDFVQLQGNESPDYCRELHSFRSITSMRSAALMKVFRVEEDFDFNLVNPYTPFCRAVVFQTHGADYEGADGPFSWEILQKYNGPLPFFLGGNILEEDAEVIRMLKHPFLMGVDLNQGFEIAAGSKDIPKIARFIKALRD